MSSNRTRNIFTLGEFHSIQNRIKARKTADLFEKDPFKIQSYNFRYAERPNFPLKPKYSESLQREKKNFDTFFYNQDFSKSGTNHGAKNFTNFYQNRRREFLQNVAPYYTSSVSSNNTTIQAHTSSGGKSNWNMESIAGSSARQSQRPVFDFKRSHTSHNLNTASATTSGFGSRTVNPSLSVQTNGNSSLRTTNNINTQRTRDKQMFTRDNISQRTAYKRSYTESNMEVKRDINSSFKKESSPISNVDRKSIENTNSMDNPATHTSHASRFDLPRGTSLKRKLSVGSGCEININIKSLNDDSVSENLTIQIARDQGSKSNLKTTNKEHSNIQLNINSSSKSFLMDKSLSKFDIEKHKKTNFKPLLSKKEEQASCSQYSLNNRRAKSSLTLNIQREKKNNAENSQNGVANQKENSKERLKILNSIYGSSQQKFANKRSLSSCNRFPSMLTWQNSSDSSKKSSGSSNLLSNQESGNQNYSTINLCGSPTTSNSPMTSQSAKLNVKNLILQKFHSFKTAKRHCPARQLYNILPTARRPLMLRNGQPWKKSRTFWSKLPFKININLFAEKVKLMKA